LFVSSVHAQLLVPPHVYPSLLQTRTDDLGDPLPPGAIARLGTLRFKHFPVGDPTIDVAFFAPDGRKIVSLVFNHANVRLWDAASGKEIAGPWNAGNRRYTAVAFSPDSALLAVAAEPGQNAMVKGKGKQPPEPQREVLLYDIATGKVAKKVPGQPRSVRGLGLIDGGKTLIAAGDGVVTWWDVATSKQLKTWTPFDEKQALPGGGWKTKTFANCAIAPDGTSIALQAVWRQENDKGGPPGGRPDERASQEAYGYNLATGKITWRTLNNAPQQMQSRFAYSADGKRLAVALGLDRVELRDPVTGKLSAAPLDGKALGQNWLGGLTLSADGAMAALAGPDSRIFVWKLADAAAPRKLTARIAQYWPNSTQCLDFSPDGKTLLVGADADLQLYDVATLQEIRPAAGHRGWIDYLAFAADGKRLLTGCADMNLYSQELASWDVTNWQRLQLTSLRAPPWPNLGIASPDQSVYVGKNGDDRLMLFDLKTGKRLARLSVAKGQPAQAGGFFSPGGKYYLLNGADESRKDGLGLYAVSSGRRLCQLPPLAMGQTVMESARPITFTTDESLVALFGRADGMVHVFETAAGKARHSLGDKLEMDNGKGQIVAHLAFAPDGKMLASWRMGDNVIRIWDMATGKELLQVMPGDGGVQGPVGPYNRGNRFFFAWSPDSRLLAVADTKIRIIELATLGVRRVLPGHPSAPVRALAFSPSGKELATGSSDTTALIWDVSIKDNTALVSGLHKTGDPTRGMMDDAALAKAWQDLAEMDAAKAFAALRALAAAPHECTAWMKQHLKPVAAIDAKHIEGLIGRLDDEQYKVRQKASADLQRIGEQIVPAIDKKLAAQPTLETQLRLQELRRRMTGMVLKGDRLRAYRAVELLECIGTPDARQVLQSLADGPAGALATMQAQAALARWRH
jgi:WD40 repeat protein